MRFFFERISKRVVALVLLAAPAFANSNYTYLALGDSIAYGYDPTIIPPVSTKFIGYPDIVASVKNLLEVNAACPGETSGSFLNVAAPDNGCQAFKAAGLLHVDYHSSQMAFALLQLQSNKHINLVTLGIGGNDLLLLQQQCAPPQIFATCVAANLPQVLTTYGNNLAQILGALRIQANYRGTLVLVNNYAPNADPLFITAVEALNSVMTTVGLKFGVTFADGFLAFQIASALYGADPCKAGLLIQLSPGTCDVHPSPKGRDLLAATVLFVTGGK